MTPIEEIKSRIDIVDFIRSYVKLEKCGQNWRALCPFHKEKTPSFFVSPTRQSWHCFGACQTGGDIFSFLMKIENIEFPEALKILAQKAGVNILREDPKIRSEKNILQDIMENATRFYQENLKNSPDVIRYLTVERGLNEKTINTFRIGWAPNEWQKIFDYLRNLGFKPEYIERSGLIVKNPQGSYFDRFRSRIMFPIFDTMGRVVGFTGRIFGQAQNDQNVAKYINTPETPLFQKSKVLYGLNFAKAAISRENSVLIVEGQMDFLAAWQEGIQNVVATSGTALTEIQIKILKRLCDTLILGFDMDLAGQSATERGVLLAISNDFTVKVLTIPDKKDISEFVKFHPGKLQKLMESPKDLIKYYFEILEKNYSLSTLDGKKQAIRYIIPRIKTISSPAERALYIRELSDILNIKEDALFEELQRLPSLLGNTASDESLAYDSPPTKTRKERLAERILGLAIANGNPKIFLVKDYLSYFPDKYKEIAYAIYNNEEKISDSELFNYLTLRGEYELSTYNILDINSEINMCLKELKREFLKEKIKEIRSAIEEAEKSGNNSAQEELSRQFISLTYELKNLS